MLSDKSFSAFAEDFVLFCHVTSRVEGEPYPNLLRKNGGTGFPTFAYLDAKGELITKYAGPRSADGFRAVGEKAKSFLSLQLAVEKGEGSAFDLFLAGLDLGRFKLVAARREAKVFRDLDAEQTKKLEASLLNLEVTEGYEANYRNKRGALALGKQWYALAKEGKAPTDATALGYYWTMIAYYGESEGDAEAKKMAEAALKKMEAAR